ncbi:MULTISPECIES: hypothetical protein [Leeuwenhoekiella]|uniref:hypothetical protein n=1 Tax=Leeuwenhoekiella TaxID=283735 RepID=UPI000C47B5A4|nr:MULTISPECIES: hypothetical protein [Leeuwenhoekiella]MAO42148.1 hypothetical protein [Leeuwenhoekiella sp.]|tara:strand:- start:158 stop:598 length:441 start_codon:yes stop_codon:yes gene_type:complete
MKTLFIDLTDRLQALDVIKWADEDKGQMNYEKPPILFPATLIDIQEPRRQNLNLKIQECNAQITVAICLDWRGNTNAVTPEVAREKSLFYYDVEEAVYQALQGWSNGQINALECVGKRKQKRPDQFTVLELVFTTQYRDSSALDAG